MITSCPKAALFDLDDTLAISFQPPTETMLANLAKLLAHMPIAIITAAGWPRICEQFIGSLQFSPHINQLYIFPNSSAECLTFQNDSWNVVYAETFTSEERTRINAAIQDAATETGVQEPRSVIIDRGPQVAYAALGLDATLEEKRTWDPDQSKRKRLQAAIIGRLPDIDVLIGGMTTIDITRKGINKAHGVRWLAEHLSLAPQDMLYVGDAFYEGGNDAVVIPTGVQTRAVSGPDETLIIVEDLLKMCGE